MRTRRNRWAPSPCDKEAHSGHSVWKTSILFTLVTAVLFGLVYPLAMTGTRRVLFPHQANGSLILRNGQVIGSELIAQSFTSDKYFHPRPSAAGNGYDATAPAEPNLAQSNAKLPTRIQGDIDALQKPNPGKPVPIDMVTTSGSVSIRTSRPTTPTTRRRAWPRRAA